LADERAVWLGVRREEEFACHTAAADIGIAPRIVGSEPNGNLLMRFAPGKHLTPEDARTPENIIRVAKTLRRLHSISPTSAGNSICWRIERLVESARVHNLELPSNIEALLVELRRREALVREGRSWVGLCHNDFWLNNFLDDGENLWLLDFEFAGCGDAMYDLATFALGCQLDDVQKELLLATHGGGDFELLEAAQFTILFFEATWSLVQHYLRGSQEHDYLSYSRSTFQRLSLKLEEPNL
jgi:thiamine kinase-like enzyme